jgi:hypothetical protein
MSDKNEQICHNAMTAEQEMPILLSNVAGRAMGATTRVSRHMSVFNRQRCIRERGRVPHVLQCAVAFLAAASRAGMNVPLSMYKLSDKNRLPKVGLGDHEQTD